MTPTALDRLAAARPHDVVVPNEERDEMLQTIVGAPKVSRIHRSTVRLAAVAAAIVAVAAVATQIDHRSGSTSSSATRAHSTVLEHVRLAVARANDDVLYVRTDAGNGAVWDAWFDDPSQRAHMRSSTPDGAPIYDHLMSWSGENGTVRVVSYRDRAWWQYEVHDRAPVTAGVPSPDEVRARIANGSLREVGREGNLVRLHADGVNTDRERSLAFDLWVDDASYLPVRMETAQRAGRAPVISTFEWHPRSATSLLDLDAPIPAGFAHLAGAPSARGAGQG